MSLSGYKARTIDDTAAVSIYVVTLLEPAISHGNFFQSAKLVTHIHHEMELHIKYCKDFGISKEEMLSMEESEGSSCSAI